MQNQMLLAILLLSSVVVGVTIGIVISVLWQRERSKRFRVEHEIPNVIGKWRCQWFDDATGSDEPKIEDTVEIHQWTTKGEFIAMGHQPEFQLSYPMVGEVDPSRVVTMAYKAARYPYEPNRGVVCMEVSRDGETMEGRWFGRRFNSQFGGGKVRCIKMVRPATVA
jgi:hypothetical protein